MCENESDAIVKSTAFSLLNELNSANPSESKLTDELLSALHCVFQSCLESALEVLEKNPIVLLQSPSGRTLYQVRGTSGANYHVLTTSLYCSCPSFIFTVLKKKTSIVCKHILAAYIAKSIGKLKIDMLTDEQLTLRIAFCFTES